MRPKKIAIDLGTANVLLFIPKEAVLINEPAVVALETPNNKLVAIGEEARKMLGRTPENMIASHPLQNGVIADYQITSAMIRYLLSKVMGGFHLTKPDVMVAVPAGATSTERRAVIDATLAAGARAAYIIKEPVAAAIGAGLPIASAAGNMIIEIGAGTCEIAILSLGGIVAVNSVRIGGSHLDNAIADFIRRKYSLAIGENTAEEIKRKLGSATAIRKEKTMSVRGRDTIAGLPKTITLSTNETAKAMVDELEKIIQAIKTVLEQTPPELSSDIIDRGMVLSGGGAKLKNLDKLLAQVTGVPCIVAEDPELCVIKGTGIALDHLDEYKRNLVSVK